MQVKPILFIEKNYVYSPAKYSEITYFSISDSKTNKNWIVQYNTTLDQIIHYAIGYIDARDYSPTLYFAYNIDLSLYPELETNRLTESEFQQKREEVS